MFFRYLRDRIKELSVLELSIFGILWVFIYYIIMYNGTVTGRNLTYQQLITLFGINFLALYLATHIIVFGMYFFKKIKLK